MALLLGSYAGGSYALSSANYTSQANSTATAQSNGLSLQTAQASDTYMSSVSALITLTDGGGDYSGSAAATGSVPDGQSLTVNALSTYSLSQSQSQSATSYEQGTYSGGTLSLSSVSYNGGGSAQQTYQTGSLMTAVSSDSGNISWLGTLSAVFFGGGTSTSAGTLTAVTTQVTASTGSATSGSNFSSYYGGSFNGSQFSFSSYSLNQSGTNQSGSLATTVTTARGTMTFSGSVIGSLGLGHIGLGTGGPGGGGGAPSTFTDSGTETFTSVDTYGVGQSALSSYAIQEQGIVSNGSYALSLYSETLQSTATATISDSSLQTSMEIGSGYTLTADQQSNTTTNSNQSTGYFELGSWQSSTGFSLSSVLYTESMASISSGSASSNQTVNFGSMSLNSATLSEVDSASSAQTHNLYESGNYAAGSYALGSYCLNDTAASTTSALKTEATSTSNFSETDSTSFVDAVHAEGSYANGSFSFGTYSHNATGLTTHTLSGSANGVTAWEHDYIQDVIVSTGSGQTATQWETVSGSYQTYNSGVGGLFSLVSYSSTTTMNLALTGSRVGIDDANAQGLATAGAPLQPGLSQGFGSLNWQQMGLVPANAVTPQALGLDPTAMISGLLGENQSTGLVDAATSAGRQTMEAFSSQAAANEDMAGYANGHALLELGPNEFGVLPDASKGKVVDAMPVKALTIDAVLAGQETTTEAQPLMVGDTTGATDLQVQAYAAACFAVGTPLLTPGGDRPIERFEVGDPILSRSDNDPDAPFGVKFVEEVFIRHAVIWRLLAGGKQIETTGEHPFWVDGRGWVAARELRIGDRLRSHLGRPVAVDEIAETGERATVYNLRVSDWHTYFVGGRSWEFSVWAHNSYEPGLTRHLTDQINRSRPKRRLPEPRRLRLLRTGLRKW